MKAWMRVTVAIWLLVFLVAPAGALPTVEGPVTGGLGVPYIGSTEFDLAPHGFVVEEFFLSGTATAYTNTQPLGTDGVWSVAPASTAPYKTRLLVQRPAPGRRFNGTVVVEWLNASGKGEAALDWIYVHTLVMREGYAWVGVTAQTEGINGVAPFALQTVDPVRYAPLVHPGDSFSYDIFSQAAQAILNPVGVDPLGGLVPRRLIATGQSQSAFRMVTYIDAVHPLAGVFDGFIVHGRLSVGAALSQAPEPVINPPGPATFIRTDLTVPVLTVSTETDLIILGAVASRQPDTDLIRTWEIAGTSHEDVYQLEIGLADEGRAVADTTNTPPMSTVAGFACDHPANAGPQQYVMQAALSRLNRWIRTGTPPPVAPRITLATETPAVIARDAYGNALGGIRTPQLDVPVATLSGLGETGPSFCFLFGTTTPFDAPTLAALYPTHRTYVTGVFRAARDAIRAGFVLRTDARSMRRAAIESDIGG